jgi:hypothetical protein
MVSPLRLLLTTTTTTMSKFLEFVSIVVHRCNPFENDWPMTTSTIFDLEKDSEMLDVHRTSLHVEQCSQKSTETSTQREDDEEAAAAAEPEPESVRVEDESVVQSVTPADQNESTYEKKTLE